MSRLSRRGLFWAACGLAVPAPAHAAGGPWLSVSKDRPDEVLVQAAAAAGTVTLPAPRCRLLRQTRLGGFCAALLSFAADRPPDIACDVLAVVGDDGTGLRLLALEPLIWRDGAGAHLATRLSVVPDGLRLLLMRDAAAPRANPLAWRRESWSDVLVWMPGAPLVDAAARAPLPGTWQAVVAERRQAVRARLTNAGTAVDPALLATLTAGLSAGP